MCMRHTLHFFDANTYYAEYDEEYAFSVVTGNDGKIIFERPSEAFSISVRLNTLPEQFGIDNHTKFFTEEIDEYTANIYEIADVTVEWDSGEAVPILHEKNGGVIYADTIVTASSDLDRALYSIDSVNKKITHTEKVTVSTGDSQYNYSHNVTYRYSSNYNKIGYMYSNGLISEDEYYELLSQYMLNGTLTSDEIVSIDGTELYWKIQNYCKRQNQNLTGNSMKVLNQLVGNSIAESTVYETSSNGHFRVYYDSNKATSEVARTVANEFQYVDDLFCSSWGFTQPYHDVSTSYYSVYLEDATTYLGKTEFVGTQGSKIYITYDTASKIYNRTGYDGYPDAYKGVVAHEYMHAILHRYGIRYDTSERRWMHESFASWAGMAYKSDYSVIRTGAIRQFLSSTEKSLDYFTDGGSYDIRHYGSCVFPLYIQQEMGGYNTIKSILLAYSDSYSPYTAIDDGLRYSGYSLSSAYAGCASYNYDTGYFYDISPKIIDHAWGGGSIYSIYDYPYNPSVTSGCNPLSCHYNRFVASSTLSTLMITVDFTSNSNRAALKTIRESEAGNRYITSRTLSGGRSTIVQYSFGNPAAKSIAIVPMNISGVSSIVKYTRTASVSLTTGTYKIANVASGKCLNIHGENVTSLYNGINVTVWSDSGTNEQKWRVDNNSSYYYVKSTIDIAYGLNVYRSGNPYNCNIHAISGNETDAQVDLIFTIYGVKIKLHNYDLYLTAASSSNGANVYWSPNSNNNGYQLWGFTSA